MYSRISSTLRSVEVPTVILGLSLYLCWLGLTFHHATLPLPVVIVVAAIILAWHGSLQHEAVHGHPTKWRRFNALFAGIPLSLWLPFSEYRRTHLRHHGVESLTDPEEDPESFYLSEEQWRRRGPARRALSWLEMTLVGRLIVGPWCLYTRFFVAQAREARRSPERTLRTWVPHLLACLPVVAWLVACGIPLWVYVLAFVYPSTALSLLRSYAEHHPATDRMAACAIVESRGPLSWIFLHNNLHALHHAEPRRPWYELPSRYRQRRAVLLSQNGGIVYRGYGGLVRRHAFRPLDQPFLAPQRAASASPPGLTDPPSTLSLG